MNKEEFEAWKREQNPFCPAIEEGTEEEKQAWILGADALFNSLEREKDYVEKHKSKIENKFYELLRRRIKEKHLGDFITDNLLEEMITNSFNETFKDE